MEEGCINLTLTWQVRAAEKGTVLKFDSNKMIGSQRSRPNLIGLTERVSKALFVSLQYEYQGLETSVR